VISVTRRIAWLVALSFVAFVAMAGVAATEEAPAKPAYDLVVLDDQVSLRVSDGLVVEIMEDLGRQLGFEVVAMSARDLKISDAFERLPSREAIRRICASAGYLEVPDPTTGKIMRLVLTGANAAAGANVLAPRRDPLPAPRPEPVLARPVTPQPPAQPASTTDTQEDEQEQPRDDEKTGDEDERNDRE
jgi:hypothetical protein